MPELRRIDPSQQPGRLRRILSGASTTRAGRFFSRTIGWKLDPVLLRATGGRLATTGIIASAVLETRGARSGATRRNAVIYFHDGDRVIVAASHAGAPTHPGWFHNLVANPEVVFGGVAMRAAQVVDPSEVQRLWSLADQVFPGYATYRRDAAAVDRSIPLIALSAA